MQAIFWTTNGGARRRTHRGRRWPGLAFVLALLLAALPGAALADYGSANSSSTAQPAAAGSMLMPNTAMPEAPLETSYAGPGLETLPAGASQLLDAGRGQMVTVHIRNLSFGDLLTVAPGTTVQWINDDNTAHTVTADDGTFDSGELAPGASFTITFTQAGFYPYYCRLHGGPGGEGMSSMVTVSDEVGSDGGQTKPPSGGANGGATTPNNGNKAAPSNGTATSNYGKSTAPKYGAMAPKYGAANSKAYTTKKAPSYGSGSSYNKGSSGRSYRSYGANRYTAPSCRAPYTTSRNNRYSAYGSARSYGMPSYRRGY